MVQPVRDWSSCGRSRTPMQMASDTEPARLNAPRCGVASSIPRRASTIVALLVAALAFAAPAGASTRRALLVGINTYMPASAAPASSTAAGRGAWSNLNGCLNDVAAIRELLVSRFGFDPRDIMTITEGQATRAGIIAAYRNHLVDPVKPGDSLLFYYAGHGSQVANSKSRETDRKDESIVPFDSHAGAADIRDKELAVLFNESIARGGALTVMLDSCHSGSGSRGLPRRERSRSLPPDPRDVADAKEPPAPEKSGALVISAAQDYQTAGEAADDDGTPHGLFSAALIDTLRHCPVNEPAERVFLRTRALMQAQGRSQEPVLAGSSQRLLRPLFGGDAKESGVVVAVARKPAGSTVTLQGGHALGLTPQSELHHVTTGESGLRLRITRVDTVASSTAEVIGGSADQIAAGDLFEVDRWVAPDVPMLRVHRGDSPFSSVALRKFAEELLRRGSDAGVRWIADPTQETPTHVVSWSDGAWSVFECASQSSRPMGSTLDAPRVSSALKDASGGGEVRAFLALPCPLELTAALRLGAGSANDAIAVEAKPDAADYVLVGRIAGGDTKTPLEYAWIRPNTLQQGNLSMPARGDWCVASDTARASNELERGALRLGRVAAWLRLVPPADSGAFPYRLALRRASDGRLVDRGEVRDGETFGLVLRTADGQPPSSIRPRWIYVFVLDSFGTSTLLFPEEGAGNVENQIPRSLGDQVGDAGLPAQIDIGPRELFTVGEPFGSDTYMLLTTAEPLPDPMVLAGAGARTRGSTRSSSALAILLGELGAATRGASPKVPANWSLERIPIVSTK